MLLPSFDLSGKTAAVTGCNVGLGAAMAEALAAAGCDIVGINRSAPDKTIACIERHGRRFFDIRADLSATSAIADIVPRIEQSVPTLDILINNAGIIRRQDALTMSMADWDDVLNVNLKAVFFLSQAVARHFVARNVPGKIINVASMLSFQGGIRVASYTASKSGILGLTRLLANEWAKYRINVNAIAPGYISTENTAALRSDLVRYEEILGRIPAGRWGEPEDLGGAVVFLASRASDYVQGHTLPVDGGWLVR
jgi:2-dehydro-3-deoxy-D-gluconate 5-dehydrogenase